ncbi:glycosyltransferase family 4 protein [Caballeronia sp. LjRoot31]|uniref:glycosyltransferase family 4 protein n=1 Tax=Caballeronia sp. LjRoot31 TaxID=3342324 RepID=UPI003F4F5E14
MKGAIRHVKEAVQAPFGLSATSISATGLVETRRFSHRLPRSVEVFNAPNLFNVAREHFRRHNRFLRVQFKDPPDVMHWTYPVPIVVPGIPNIYTIHDLVPLRLPYTTLDNKRYYFRLIKKCIEVAARICTVSEQSKMDIEAFFPPAKGTVFNTYQAVDVFSSTELKSDEQAYDEVMGLYGLKPKSYFLFFGAIEPKKNVGRLIEAFMSIPLDSTLVIAGSMAWKSDEEMKLYNSLISQDPRLKRRIKILGYLPHPFLVSLIRSAKAVVFPSLYEGFGLPVLEAMELGTPTLCSREGSLTEVAGDASVFVDAYEVGSIASGLESLERNDELRHKLVTAGKHQAAKFSKRIYQERLSELYRLA